MFCLAMILDQVEKIVISKESVVKLNLIWGIVSFVAAIGAFFAFAFNFLNLGVLSLFLVVAGSVVGSINLYIYRFQPAWFIRKYEANVQKQTGNQVIVQ